MRRTFKQYGYDQFLAVSNQFETADYAYLAVHLPDTECAQFAAYQQSNITDDTTVFDPLVDNLDKLRTQFEKPLRDSWHARMV